MLDVDISENCKVDPPIFSLSFKLLWMSSKRKITLRAKFSPCAIHLCGWTVYKGFDWYRRVFQPFSITDYLAQGANCKDRGAHSCWALSNVSACMTSHEQQRPKWPQLQLCSPQRSAPAWAKRLLALCLWEDFGCSGGWIGGHWGSQADNSSNSSWDGCMQVQMQVTHWTSPCFQATKKTGRDLSGQHSGLWRQQDQLTPSTS